MQFGQMSNRQVKEKLQQLRRDFACKRVIIATAVDQYDEQKMYWESRFSDNSELSRALSFAKSRKSALVVKLREFKESFTDIFENNVDHLLASDSMDWPRLDMLMRRAMSDRALNVANPIWANFLKCFHDLMVTDADAHYLQVCRELIGRIQRWEPDERFINGDARKVLSILSKTSSDNAEELQGILFCA